MRLAKTKKIPVTQSILTTKTSRTWSYNFAKTCNFYKRRVWSLRPYLLGDTSSPEVTRLFFEFLKESCFTPLNILYLSTRVNFKYNYPLYAF